MSHLWMTTVFYLHNGAVLIFWLVLLGAANGLVLNSSRRQILVAMTTCPQHNWNTTLSRFRMGGNKGFNFSEAICDEASEYQALLKIPHMPAHRIYIVLVSFPANCPTIGVVQKGLQWSSVVILVGCEEITWRRDTEMAKKTVMIQMTTPAWYPAQILRHLRRPGDTQKHWSLAATSSCTFVIDHMLREDTDMIRRYHELLSDAEGLVLPADSDSDRQFLCLSMHDLESFPEVGDDSQKNTIDLFVRDASSSAAVRAALELRRDRGSLNVISFTVARNYTAYIQDAINSFTIASILAELIEESCFTSNETDTLSRRITELLSDLDSIAGLYPMYLLRDNNVFAQLPNWKMVVVEFIGNSSSVETDRLQVVVRRNNLLISPSDAGLPLNTTSSSNPPFTLRLPLAPGFFFNVTVDNSGQSTASRDLILYLAVGICSFLLVISLLIVGAYSRQKYLKAHLTKDRTKFFVESDDLTPISKRTNTVQSVNSANNSKSTNGFLSNGNAGGSHHHHHDTHKSQASIRTSDSFGEKYISAGDNYAKFNGDVVFLRYLRTKHIQLKVGTRQLIGNMRDLRGDNINAFVAFFIGAHTPFRPPAVVFEYSQRGSLMDLIDKEEIKLDWSFKVSFLTDLVRGLKAIHHSQIRFHGRLTSRKCVIDNRWTLKITDYAIARLEVLQNGGKAVEGLSDEQLLWTAPEVLRASTPALRDGTPKGDVYSVGIIMQELILRGRPFCTTELSAKEIIAKVRHPPPMLRPHVSNQTAQPEAITIMKECWTENPDVRPSVDEVVGKFKALNQGRKVNIVDSMFVMLEKYSNNLEELIHERTEELNEEKRKTEQLLYRMMPQTVAEKLKLGEPVEPESFSEVTIYFSDIVGFTTISAHSTPMEIVNLLNDLYSLFDSTLSFYDVYKVETIGDAYMVVSGLPVANGNKHAGEIASVALDLLYQCGRFKIRHLFDVPLMLRIGIHTGSCAAGVVGLTMPRYCLFGDTVNTASRMESTSRAYRIHVSEESQRKLTELGGYNMVLRGITQVKGKGDMQTFWLEGKTGFDKPLPQPAPDNGENHGLDEALIIRGRELQRAHDGATIKVPNGMGKQLSFDDS